MTAEFKVQDSPEVQETPQLKSSQRKPAARLTTPAAVTPSTVTPLSSARIVQDDALEDEADRAAQQVSAPQQGGTQVTGRISSGIQRRAAGADRAGVPVPASVEQVLAQPGEALPQGPRLDMEGRFGADFSGVRVHTGTQAAQSAADIDARAYTLGQHIVFGEGEFKPGTAPGRELLAHELTHTIQQGSGAARRVARKGKDHHAAPPAGQAGTPAQTQTAQTQTQPAPAQADAAAQLRDAQQPAAPFEIDGQAISNKGNAALLMLVSQSTLDSERAALTQGGLAVPDGLPVILDETSTYLQAFSSDPQAPLSQWDARNVRLWWTDFKTVVTACRAAQAAEAARRAQAAAAEQQRALQALENALPALRDSQRAAFRAGNENNLLKTADTVATVVDTSLVTKDSITAITSTYTELNVLAMQPSITSVQVASGTQKIVEAVELANKAWAGFQLARAALDLASGGTTSAAGGRAAVGAMATTVSAGGTLLGASVPFTLYSNLYVGPLTEACLNLLAKLEDLRSRTDNRAWIELGEFDSVNWSLEPGGRPVFDFMLQLMRADSADAVPTVPEKVSDYFVDQEDSLNAGTGKKDEMPTDGHWFWKSTDSKKIRSWAFRQRENLWGMFYGAAKVPAVGAHL